LNLPSSTVLKNEGNLREDDKLAEGKN